MGILSPLSRHAKLFGSGVYFTERRLIVNPYFQYFSSSLMYKYQLGLHKHLEQPRYITLYFSRVQQTYLILLLFSFPLLYYDVTQ